MRARITLVMAFWLAIAGLWAKPVAEVDARNEALAFCGRLQSAGRSGVTSQMLTLVENGNKLFPEYYVFNVEGNRGYIVVAGDDRMSESIPIYSLNGSFDPNGQGNPLHDILASYAETVRTRRSEPESARRAMRRSVVPLVSKAPLSQVEPLLGSIAWNQLEPYNRQCPLFDGTRAYTGCGATAASMVMKFHAYPKNGVGVVKITNPKPDIVVDLSKANYNWELMTPTYGGSSTEDEKNEVAKLMMNVGAAFSMIYGPDASGTNVRGMVNPFINNFLYHKDVRSVYREGYPDDEWLALLKKEIDLKRPIIYSGDNPDQSVGHIFVCDSYDSDGRFHFNFGWGGYLNAYMQLEDCPYPKKAQLLVGLFPSTQSVAEADLVAPQVTMIMPLTPTVHSPALGEAFSIGTKVDNYNQVVYNGQIGLALYNKADGSMVGTVPLVVKDVNLKVGAPGKPGSNVEFAGFSIPKGTPDGRYALRMMVKGATLWHLAQFFYSEMNRDLDVEVKDGVANLSYPLGNMPTSNHLELIKPIEVAVASNRATVSFSIGNADEFYECKRANVFVLVAPNNSPIPTVARNVEVRNLASGLVQDFKISDVPLPSGATSCRIYVGYSRVDGTSTNPFAALPMGNFANNFKSYTIPQESVLLHQNFVGKGNEIPATFKMYLQDGTPSTDAWKGGILSKASTTIPFSKLVTHSMTIKNENVVLEWQMSNMSENETGYKIYLSENGQDFTNFKEPVFKETLPNETLARLYLGDYAGKDICLAFETESTSQYSLLNYKLLEIKTPKDISLEKVVLQGTALVGDQLPVKVQVKNNSAADITTVKAGYTIGSKKVEQVFTTRIAFNDIKELTFDQPIAVAGISGDVTPVKVRVDIAGEDPSLLGNNEKEATYAVADFYPKKSVLFYKTTKVACGGCTVTFTCIDDYEHFYPESTAGVELWRKGSGYWISAFDNFTNEGTTPRFFLNGKMKDQAEIAINQGREEVQSMNPPADVWTENGFDSETGRRMTVKVKVRFAMPTVGTYKVGAILIENNVIDNEGQIAGQEADVKGAKLVKNHLPIAMIGGPSSDFTIVNPQAQEYVFDAVVDIPAETDKRYRKENIQVIAVLYNPKGEIINCSLDSYYLKLPQTAGLTFKAESGYRDPKLIYDIKSVRSSSSRNPVYRSVSNYRATLLSGGTYRFTIQKDGTWSGKKPKLIVNKEAYYNGGKEEVLLPDENGVYTISEADRHFFVTIEQVDATEDPFTVKHDGKVLANGATVEIKEHSEVGSDQIMKAEFEVTKNSGSYNTMRMTKEIVSLTANTYNDMCWVDCVEQSTLTVNSFPMEIGVPQVPYAQLYLNYDGQAVGGTSIIKYKFDTTDREIKPLTVTVKYTYDDNPTQIKQGGSTNGLVVYTTAQGSIGIHSDETVAVHIRTIDGRLIKSLNAVVGTTSVEGLPHGVYLVNGCKVIL